MWDAIIIQPFINVLLLIYTFVGQNFGIAIILFTLLIRLVTHPLTAKQLSGTQKMQELQKDKRWIEIQEKYKGDREKLAQEQMRVYKELGINPLGSCLPTVIQFPIIIGLYQSIIQTLASTPIELLNLSKHIYNIPLLKVGSLIPLNSKFLWMNLGSPERAYIFGVGIPILAIIVVITTYLQSKLMTPPSASPNDQGAQMSKMMNLYMPFLMGYLAYTLASGLSLYFVTSNLIGIFQYTLLGRVDWRNVLPFGNKSRVDARTAVADVKPKAVQAEPKYKITSTEADNPKLKVTGANGRPKSSANPKPKMTVKQMKKKEKRA